MNCTGYTSDTEGTSNGRFKYIPVNKDSKSNKTQSESRKPFDVESGHQYIELRNTEKTSLIPLDNFEQIEKSQLMAKVYSVLSVQLVLTFLVVLPMYIHKKYIINNFLDFYIPSFFLTIGLLVLMFFTEGIKKLFVSFVFAISMGLMIGTAIVNYNVDVLVQATLITLGTTLFCTMFVYITQIDLHSWKGILSTYLWLMILMSFVFIFIPINNVVHTIYCALGIVCFVGYILYDTSDFIVSKKHRKDYIEISTGIYLDIINLFLYILQSFVGGVDNR